MSALRLFVVLLATGTLLAGCGLFRDAPGPAPGTPQPQGPVGSIELSLIDRSTLRQVPAPLQWHVRSHRSHPRGEQVVYSGNTAGPYLQLSGGWYLVDVQHDRGVTTHIFEIYPGVHQNMHLVRMTH